MDLGQPNPLNPSRGSKSDALAGVSEFSLPRTRKEFAAPAWLYESLAATLLADPPKQQIIRNGNLDWKDKDPPRNTGELLQAMRRVRNYLLHGGKAGDPEETPDKPGRNTTLIAEAHYVAHQILLRLADVRLHFEGQY
jgi:hypothetical protein